MEMIDHEIQPSCLICNEHSVDETFISLSDENVKNIYKNLVESIISQILSKHSNGPILQHDLICTTCFDHFKQVHEMEEKLQMQKEHLMNRFKSTILSDNDDNDHEEEDFEKGPKKILDIPSSDEDEQDKELQYDEVSINQDEKKLKTIEEIEEELVKMHGPADIPHLELLQQNVSDVKTLNDQLSKDEETIMVADFSNTQNIKIETSEESMEKSKVLKRTIDGIKQKEIKEELTVDEMVTRTNSLYTCMMCEGDETVCGEAKAIMAHIKEAHDARLYICDMCGDYFKKRNALSAHMDDHVANEDGDFQCEVCNRIFNNLRLFRIHKRVHNPQNKGWTCDRCGKKYSSKNLLEEHMNTHTGYRPYQCTYCNKDFSSKYTFKAHEKTHEQRTRPHTCSKCPKTFLSLHNLLQHGRTHAGVKEFECHLCDKKFGTQHNLEVHSVVHTNYKPYICGLCGKSFARKAEIRDHERTHTGERPYQCEFCGATFSQRSNLQSHKRATHYDDKRYKCNTCGKGFKRRRLLDYHIKAAHTGERPYKCAVCDASFIYPEHFKKHRRIHTGEKPYFCEVCGKAFNSRDNRNAHRFVHSDKKPYQCLDCGAGFMRKPLLYQHMQAENHLNDTIIVNQPHLPDEEEQYLTLNEDGQLEITQRKSSHIGSDMEEVGNSENEKLFIAERMLVGEDDDDEDEDMDEEDDEEEDKVEENQHTLILGDSGNETIIIDGQQFQFKGEVDEDEDSMLTTTEDFDGIITPEVMAGAQTQIIQTKEGPVQLLAVRIPNDNGEEEEAWIKILPENMAE